MRKTDNSLSIAIPVYNEEKRLENGLDILIDALRASSFDDYEIIVCDNGSTDSTMKIAEEYAERYSGRMFCCHTYKKGVGRALKIGWVKSSYNLLCSIDVDMSADPCQIARGVSLMRENKCDIVNGSRNLHHSKVTGRNLLRKTLTAIFNLILRIVFASGITDGMSGFQIIRRSKFKEVLDKHELSDQWFFSAELFLRMEALGMNTCEMPVRWIEDDESKVRVIQLSLQYISEIIRLRRQIQKR